MNKKFIAGLVVVAIIAIGGYYFPMVKNYVGANAGPDHYVLETFFSGLIEAGRYSTTTSAELNNITISAGEMRRILGKGECYLDVAPSRIHTTITLTASSSLSDVLPRAGDRTTCIVRNATSTADGNFRFAAGTGWEVNVGSTTPASTATTTPGEYAILTFYRKLDDVQASASTTLNGTKPGDLGVFIQHMK